MQRHLTWIILVILSAALLLVPAAAAKEKEKGPKELAAEAKVAASPTVPRLIEYKKLGKKEAREAGVPDEIAATLPLESVDLPLVPSEVESPAAKRAGQSRTRVAAWAGCWRAIWQRGAGTWPFHRDIYQDTTWCTTMQNTIGTYYGRSWVHSGYGCAPNYGPTYERVGGGVGISSVDIETRAGFICNIYWYGMQTWLWMVPRYYGDGRTAMAAWGQ